MDIRPRLHVLTNLYLPVLFIETIQQARFGVTITFFNIFDFISSNHHPFDIFQIAV